MISGGIIERALRILATENAALQRAYVARRERTLDQAVRGYSRYIAGGSYLWRVEVRAWAVWFAERDPVHCPWVAGGIRHEFARLWAGR